MNSMVYLYVFDTMADWEIGYLSAELNSGRFFKKGLSRSEIVTVGMDKTPVTTMGGLKVLPDITLEECDITKMDALILPGGDTWLEPFHQPVINLARRCMEEGILVAAICAATAALAQNGFLNSRWHTSNDLNYLKLVSSGYQGEEFYRNEPAVTEGKLITASGTAPLEFTYQVLKALEVFSLKTLEIWYQFFKTSDPKYYFELTNSIDHS